MWRRRTTDPVDAESDQAIQDASLREQVAAQMRQVVDAPGLSAAERYRQTGRLRKALLSAQQSKERQHMHSEATIQRRIRWQTWRLRWIARLRLHPVLAQIERRILGFRCRLYQETTNDAFEEGWPSERVILTLSWDNAIDRVTRLDNGDDSGQSLQLTLDGDLLVRVYAGGRTAVEGRVSLHHPQWKTELSHLISSLFVPMGVENVEQ